MPQDYQLIKENLRLTQEYCESRLANSTFDNAAIFRSINPDYGGQPLFNYAIEDTNEAWPDDYNIAEWSRDPYIKGNEMLILELFDYQLNIKKSSPKEDATKEISKDGKIFAFLINETLIDGAAAHASEGILDNYNCPPIDTWIHILFTTKGPTLLAWIPDFFTHLVNDGIDVNPEQCIQWLDVWHPDIYDQIINA